MEEKTRMNLPEFIYKYVDSDKLLKIIRGGKLYFSSPKNFNDPFDCKIHIPDSYRPAEIELYAIKIFGRDFVEQLKGPNNSNDKSIDKSHILFHKLGQLMQTAAHQVGVSCFTEDHTNLLMWAHYADCHRGACIKFNTQKLLKTFPKIERVIYSTSYEALSIFRDYDYAIKNAPRYKSDHWSYEKEVRIIQPQPGLYEFDKSAIDEIFLGVNHAGETQLALIESKIMETSLLRQGQISNADYKIHFNIFISYEGARTSDLSKKG
jgi:hypothetical protein